MTHAERLQRLLTNLAAETAYLESAYPADSQRHIAIVMSARTTIARMHGAVSYLRDLMDREAIPTTGCPDCQLHIKHSHPPTPAPRRTD